MTASFWCVRCGKTKKLGTSWCATCHSIVVTLMRYREMLPVGCNGETNTPWREPEKEKRTDVRLLEMTNRLHGTAVCSECGRVEPVYGHILGKPYCTACLNSGGCNSSSVSAVKEDDGGPWQQNAVRAMEDAFEETLT